MKKFQLIIALLFTQYFLIELFAKTPSLKPGEWLLVQCYG